MIKILIAAVLIMGAGCTVPPQPQALIPTATMLRVIQATTVPTFDRRIQAVDVPTPTTVVCEPTSLGRPTHEVFAVIDYGARLVSVDQQIVFPNLSGRPVESLVLDVEPNAFPGAFVLREVLVDRSPAASYELLDRRMTISLGSRAPESGCAVSVSLRFQLMLPRVPEGWAGRSGYFGYTDRQLNLGRWLPVVAHRQGGDWIVHETTPIGEQSVADVADWRVNLQVVNAPESVSIAAPGESSRPTADSERFSLAAARDFAVSISPQFVKRSQVTRSGITVDLYALGDTQVQTERGLMDGAEHALDVASRSLELFGELFAPYPYARLVVVEGDFADGMEFSSLIFVGEAWFRTWTGTPQSYLTIITAHEVAHQWWYASVGSDQAMTPWLDEALATYSELVFYQDTFPELADWWWQFRVHTFLPPGFSDVPPVSSSIYHFQDVRAYINAVYLRGALMLDQLRGDIGTEPFFDWLAAYAVAGRERIVTPDLLWELLSPRQRLLTQATRQAYLGS